MRSLGFFLKRSPQRIESIIPGLLKALTATIAPVRSVGSRVTFASTPAISRRLNNNTIRVNQSNGHCEFPDVLA